MDTLHFKAVNDQNEIKVKALELKANQLGFIESVDECLKEARECDLWRPVAIYMGEEVVGFAMYGSFENNKYTWIDRIMIDKNYQGKGIGREAMNKLMKKVSSEYDASKLYLSIIEDNQVARKLYESLGFRYTNEKDKNGELIFEYIV